MNRALLAGNGLAGAFARAALMGIWVLAVALSGCGDPDDTSSTDRCKGVICEYGVCDGESGACVNPDACDSNHTCIGGFQCVEGTCETQFPCGDDGRCEGGGICVGGACLNPDACSVSQECLPTHYCDRDAGQCKRSLCDGVTCERGECEPSSGQCLNKATCSAATAEADCLEGYLCVEQQCRSRDAVCDALDCEGGRGVCDPDARACVNATHCAGQDRNCLDGYFCNDNNACQENLCQTNNVTCDRGLCAPASGACANAPSCAANTDCLDDHYCIEGTCRTTTAACEVCTGNQSCSYDEGTRTVACAESQAGCRNGFDCAGDRVCRLGTCEEPASCAPDLYEPNDTADAAVDLKAAMAQGLVEPSLCAGDVDQFVFDNRGLGLTRGTFVVELRLDSEDVGNGQAHVRVFNPAGDPVAEATSNAAGRAALNFDVLASELGAYRIEVAAGANMNPAGARYTLSADFVSPTVSQACTNARELEPGTTTGDSKDGASYELTTSCTSENNTAREHIYRFTLERRSVVDLAVSPRDGAGEHVDDIDLTLAIRQSCVSKFSELACADDEDGGGTEQIRATLDAGEYFVIVKGPTANSGGPYALTFSAEPVVCYPGSGMCTSDQESTICNAFGTGYNRIDCEMGCNTDSGLCTREPGDVCYAAIDASAGFDGEIDWSRYADDFNPGEAGCVSDNAEGRRTDGADVTYRVSLPPGQALFATLTTSTDYASMYLVRDCMDAGDSCVGASSTANRLIDGRFQQTLAYVNTSRGVERFFLIADSAASGVIGRAHIDIQVGPTLCAEGDRRCGAEGVEICNDARNGFVLERACGFGCDDASTACNPVQNQVCKGAVDILAHGGKFVGRIEDYANSYNAGFYSCTERTLAGPDATFVVEASEGDIITATLHSEFDGGIYVVTDCSQPGESCVAGSSEYDVQREVVQFAAPEDGRYYIIVDSSNNSTGTFTLDVSVELAMCPAGNPLGCIDDLTMSYCGSLGAPVSYRCESGCIGGACAVPSGELCLDAIPAFHGDMLVGNLEGWNSMQPGSGVVGHCDFGTNAPIGTDTFYAIELEQDDLLFINGTTNSDNLIVYIIEDCADASTCLANSRRSGTNITLEYQADRDKTVIVAVSSTYSLSSSFFTYALNVQIERPECTPGEMTCLDAATLQYCDKLGQHQTYTCEGGCENDACQERTGDTCMDAIPLEAPAYVSRMLSGTNAMQTGGGQRGQCNFGSWELVGADHVYSVDVEAGQRLEVVMTNNDYLAMYILEECFRPSSCVATVSNNGGEYNHHLEYVATEDRTVYIVVDRSFYTDNAAPYDLYVGIQEPGGCTVGESVCLDDRTVGICNDGEFYTSYACEGGCESGRCTTPRGEACHDAIPLASGERVQGGFHGTNTLSVGPGLVGACDMGDAATVGHDTMYAVEMQAGEELYVRLDSGIFSSIVYVVEDCEDASTCLAVSESGGSSGNANVVETTYTADRDKTVYVVVDRVSTGRAVQPYMLEVFVTAPDGCTPGAQRCMDDGSTLGLCNAERQWEYYACDGTCTDDRCDTPRGDICQDAIVLIDGQSVTGKWLGTNSINPGTGDVGQCSFGSQAQGRETIYAVTVPVGMVLAATLETDQSTAMLYMMQDCNDVNSCIGSNLSTGAQSLHHLATFEQTVYLVVDRNNGSLLDAEYTLHVSIESPECISGTTECTADGTGIRVCNQLAVWEEHACSSSICTDGACDDPQGEACFEARPLTPGVAVEGDFQGTDTLNPGEGQIGTCSTAYAAPGRDTIYSVELRAGEVLTAWLTTTLNTSMIYILEDCYDASSCLDTSHFNDGMRVNYVADRDKTVFVVVDRSTAAGSSVAYTLHTEVATSGSCTPGARECSTDGTAARACNRFGVWEEFECSSSCSDGRCLEPSGTYCLDAIALQPGTTYTGAFNNGPNTLNPGQGEVGQCAFTGTQQGSGLETIYSIDLVEGQLLRVDVTTTQTTALLYILEDCEVASSCLANTNAGRDPTLYYQAQRTGTVYVVVDRNSSSPTSGVNTAYSLVATVQDPCVPGTSVCDPDGVTMHACRDDRMAYPYDCDGGCDAGRCVEQRGDICQDAIVLSSGDSHSSNWSSGINLVNPGTGDVGQCSFGTTQAQGLETIYAVDVMAGETMTARLSTTVSTAMMYILEDCMRADSCVAYAGTGATTLRYTAETDRRVFVVVDRSAAAALSTAYTISVDVQPPSCAPGDTYCIDESTLAVCNHFGIWDEYACAGGCEADRCGTPRGDICVDAIPLEPGTDAQASTGSLTMANHTGRIDPGMDTCILSGYDRQIGRDMVFAVDLSAGQVLHAELVTTQATAGMYILDSCATSPAKACRAASPRNKKLSYVAESTQTYYLVVDATLAATSNYTFELLTQVESTSYLCAPNESLCDPQTGVLSVCAEDGSHNRTTMTCAHGCERGRYCAPAPEVNDTCETAYPITASTRIVDAWARFTGDYNPGTSSCVGAATSGPDAVYSVTLDAGEVLVTTATGGRSNNNVGIYYVSGCDDISATCLAGTRPARPAQLGYHSEHGEQLYVVVDSSSTSFTDPFVVDFEIRPAECVPGEQVCLSERERQYCLEHHLFATESCAYGCEAGECTPPMNNTCAGAVDATGGLDITVAIDDYTNVYNPGSSLNNCTGRDANGPEAVFYVDLLKNEKVTVRMAANDRFDPSIWITTDCSDAARACVAGKDANGNTVVENLEYVAPHDGRYYIMADVYQLTSSTQPTGTFDLRIEVSQPTCAWGETSCLDDTTLGWCTYDGTTVAAYTCDGACIDGACTHPRGDICEDVIWLDHSGTVTGTFAGMTNQLDPGFAGCTGFDAPGPEAVYAVALASGQTLTATLRNADPGATTDLSLYVVDNCYEPRNTCQAGSDAYGPGAESLVYTALGNEVVYLVADSWTAGATTAYELDVQIQ